MPPRTGHRNRTGQMAGSGNPSCLYFRTSSLLCPVLSGQRFGSIPSQATDRSLVLRDILASRFPTSAPLSKDSALGGSLRKQEKVLGGKSLLNPLGVGTARARFCPRGQTERRAPLPTLRL